MCRLFGLHAGPEPVSATFWLTRAPDNLVAQSWRNPDGAGIGVFAPDGTPVVDKEPLAAWRDLKFLTAARELRSTTFIAHVRFASTGGLSDANTHPFEQDGRIFAHNGVLQNLPALDARLEELHAADLVRGETDSERLFALITAEIRRRGGDVRAGITDAITWISDTLAVFSLNFVLTAPHDLWALRYPATHELYVLDRPSGGSRADPCALEATSVRIETHCEHLATRASVLVATERMDDDPAWRLLEPGELVHVGPGPRLSSSIAFPDEPRHLLKHEDLNVRTAASQR